MERLENMKIALKMSQTEYEFQKNTLKKYDLFQLIVLALNILVLIPLTAILEMQNDPNNVLFIIDTTLITSGIVASIVTIVFCLLGIFSKNHKELDSNVYLSCGDEEEKYILSLLFNFVEIKKENDKAVKTKAKYLKASIISLVCFVGLFLLFIIMCLI